AGDGGPPRGRGSPAPGGGKKGVSAKKRRRGAGGPPPPTSATASTASTIIGNRPRPRITCLVGCGYEKRDTINRAATSAPSGAHRNANVCTASLPRPSPDAARSDRSTASEATQPAAAGDG